MDKYVILTAFVAALLAVVALVLFTSAEAVKTLELVPIVGVLAGALAGLAKR